MGDIVENPGLAEGDTPDHYTIATRERQHTAGVGCIFHIAIAKNGNGDGFFHLPNHIPIGITLKTLFRIATMHRDGFDSGLFSGFGEGN